MSHERTLLVGDFGTGDRGMYFFANQGPERRVCIDLRRNFLDKFIQEHKEFLASPDAKLPDLAPMSNKSFEAIEADIRHLQTTVHFFDEIFDHVDVMFPFQRALLDLLSDDSKIWTEMSRLIKKDGIFRIVTETYSGDSLIQLDVQTRNQLIQVKNSIPRLLNNANNAGFEVEWGTISNEILEYLGTTSGNAILRRNTNKSIWGRILRWWAPIEVNLIQGVKR